MREIKFRAWNKEENIMCYENEDFEADYWDGHYASLLETINDSLKTDKYIFMQYVGLKDKNGTEIYEGDIVKKETFDDTKPNYIAVSYAKVIYFEHLAGFYLVNRDNKILWEVGQDKYNIEVVSTIYENPELLEDK